MIKYYNIYSSSLKLGIAFYAAAFSSYTKADLKLVFMVLKWFLISANYFSNFSNKTVWYYSYYYFPINYQLNLFITLIIILFHHFNFLFFLKKKLFYKLN